MQKNESAKYEKAISSTKRFNVTRRYFMYVTPKLCNCQIHDLSNQFAEYAYAAKRCHQIRGFFAEYCNFFAEYREFFAKSVR